MLRIELVHVFCRSQLNVEAKRAGRSLQAGIQQTKRYMRLIGTDWGWSQTETRTTTTQDSTLTTTTADSTVKTSTESTSTTADDGSWRTKEEEESTTTADESQQTTTTHGP